MKWIVAAGLALGMLLLALYQPAWSQDRGAWFKSLRTPDTGISCCDVSDCKRTEAEWKGGQWHAVVNGAMTPIPPRKVLENKPSIDGEAYVCAGPASGRIYCFIKPNMGF